MKQIRIIFKEAGRSGNVDIHPDQIPVSQIFELKQYSEVSDALNEMLSMDLNKESGFKVLIPKERALAKKMGYTIVNELNRGLRIQGYHNKVRFFIYHHDPEHYAIILVTEDKLAGLYP